MKEFFDIGNTLIEIGSYQLSYLETIGTLFGLASVWLAAKANRHTWTTGIISVSAFFYLFYQVSLYSDMFLQGFFFITSIFGWFMWKKNRKDVPITIIKPKHRLFFVMVIIITSMMLAKQIQTIHVYYSNWFPEPAAFPIADAFTTVLSVVATFFLMKKKVEAWILWIIVDIVSIWIYFQKGIWLVGFEYCIFLFMATYGGYRWLKILQNDKRNT
ncbi:MAG: nicotinamide riboside transporter PnuC [bacterium]|nr:nicotinamide riboside transporter PnuC [bacterium]